MKNAKNTKRADKLNIKYSLAQEDPMDVERRVRRAFEILFDEMEKAGKLTNNNVKKHEINTK